MPELDNAVGALIVEGFETAGIALPIPKAVTPTLLRCGRGW